MNARRPLRRLIGDRNGAGAAEFALVLPVLLLLLFVIIDIGRLYYVVNESEKATQMGARFAIVTDTIPAKIANADYVGVIACPNLASPGTYKTCATGDYITDPTALGKVTCTSTSCTCATGGTCPTGIVMGTGKFAALGDRMRAFNPAIADTNINLYFQGSGLGYAGDSTGMDVIPLVTVELTGLQFRPLAFLSLVPLTLPAARTTLSAESSAGTQSN